MVLVLTDILQEQCLAWCLRHNEWLVNVSYLNFNPKFLTLDCKDHVYYTSSHLVVQLWDILFPTNILIKHHTGVRLNYHPKINHVWFISKQRLEISVIPGSLFS